MSKAIQISAPISKETKDLLEQQVKATGIKKGHLIESALRYRHRGSRQRGRRGAPVDAPTPASLSGSCAPSGTPGGRRVGAKQGRWERASAPCVHPRVEDVRRVRVRGRPRGCEAWRHRL